MPSLVQPFARRPIPPVDWETALFALLHPLQIAIVEAHFWIEEPLSATSLVRIFDGSTELNGLAYHVRRLAEGGVLCEAFTQSARGALEHFYRLA